MVPTALKRPTTDAARKGFRALFDSVRFEAWRGVLVFYPETWREFEAVQYVLCTDERPGVVRAPMGDIASYRNGEFCGWQPTVGIAVDVCRSTFR